jgi:hypothetical protein
MDCANQIADNEAERFNNLARTTIAAEAEVRKGDGKSDTDFWSAIFEFGVKAFDEYGDDE